MGTGTASPSSGTLGWPGGLGRPLQLGSARSDLTGREGNEPGEESKITYAELQRRVAKFASALKGFGTSGSPPYSSSTSAS
jgi:hypothetical protein